LGHEHCRRTDRTQQAGSFAHQHLDLGTQQGNFLFMQICCHLVTIVFTATWCHNQPVDVNGILKGNPTAIRHLDRNRPQPGGGKRQTQRRCAHAIHPNAIAQHSQEVHDARASHMGCCLRFHSTMRTVGLTVLLLSLSNIFMTFAWYAHLKELGQKPWLIAALVSWGIAFFEYLLQVPGNRIGYTALSVGQLKLLQEAITLTVFVPFALLYLKEPLKLDYLWAALCILGAVYFVFRSKLGSA
jgi:uncharacterized protein (DUF486 family)